MHKLHQIVRGCRSRLVTADGFAALVLAILAAMTGAPSIRAQSPPDFKYEIASIKLSKPRTGDGMFFTGMRDTPDGFVATNAPLLFLVQSAYGVNRPQISGAPSWLNSELYDVDAKMDSSVVDAFQKLSSDEQKSVRRKMLQSLLADRMKLVVHNESKETAIYSLVIAKNGPKLQESKPSAAPANAASGATGGRGAGGGMSMGNEDGMTVATFREMPISYVASWLTAQLRAPVSDKTGLTGSYDFKLKWTPERSQRAVPPSGQPASEASDPAGPTLLDALQDQLGLKLESGKGSVDGIAIDHIEKPSGN
jgi:uncharacterized protein (TIGR03435 family)